MTLLSDTEPENAPKGSEDGSPGKAPSVPVISLGETERNWLLLVAHLHLEQRRPVEACTMLRVLNRVNPGDPRVLRCLALAELMSGNAGTAARIASRAMQTTDASEFHVPVGLIFARALWEQGQHEAARDYASNLLNEFAEKSN